MSNIPWQQQAIDANEAAKLFGLSKDRFLRNIACRSDFPKRINVRPASWVAGELIEYREKHIQRQNYARGA